MVSNLSNLKREKKNLQWQEFFYNERDKCTFHAEAFIKEEENWEKCLQKTGGNLKIYFSMMYSFCFY